MSGVQVVTYDSRYRRTWNDFVAASKNATFLFNRDYMEYHADRFSDASLMFFDDRKRLLALLPATFREGVFASHAGLTYGGMLSNTSMNVALMLEIFEAMCVAARCLGAGTIVYKPVPHIYHDVPAEEDLYALFIRGAHLAERDVSLVVALGGRPRYSKGRQWKLNQARKRGLEVRRTDDFDTFHAIVTGRLREKFGARPVHTAAELLRLACRFPDNIKLFSAGVGTEMLAGVVVYETKHVVRIQYIGTTEQGRLTGALDVVLDYLITDHYAGKRFLDLGTSRGDDGSFNIGLVENKHSYGGRAIAYDVYTFDLCEAPAVKE